MLLFIIKKKTKCQEVVVDDQARVEVVEAAEAVVEAFSQEEARRALQLLQPGLPLDLHLQLLPNRVVECLVGEVA